MTGQLLSLETGNFIKIFAFYLTLRSLVSPGKSSPVIRRGLFLTGDQAHDGGKGGAVKNRGAKRPFNCAAQLNFVSSRHGKIYLPRQKVWSVLVVRLPPSLKLWRDKQLRKLACRTGGFVCHIKTLVECAAPFFIVQPQSISFHCGTGRAPNKQSAVEAHK